MTSLASDVAQRVQEVEWTATDYLHTRSRVLLMKEFLRRSALWAEELDLGDRWPFIDVARALRGSDTAPTVLLDEVRATLELKMVGGYVTEMALAGVNLAAMRDSSSKLPDLLDLYEPLLVMFERGGGFSVDGSGMIDVDYAGVAMKTLEYHAARPSIVPLDSISLDPIDAAFERARSAGSMTEEGAILLACELLKDEFGQAMKTAHHEDVVILLDKVTEFASAWSVPFNTQQYLDTDDPVHALVPSIIIIPKDRTIAPHLAPSAIDTAEYLRSVASGKMPWTVRHSRSK